MPLIPAYVPSYQKPAGPLRLDPQAPEAQGLVACGAVPAGVFPGFPYRIKDASAFQWPLDYYTNVNAEPTKADPVVGGYQPARQGLSGGATIKVQLSGLPSFSNATMALWVRNRAATQLNFCDLATVTAGTAGLYLTNAAGTPVIFDWAGGNFSDATGLFPTQDEWTLLVGTASVRTMTTYLFAPGKQQTYQFTAGAVTTRNVTTLSTGTNGAQNNYIADYSDVLLWNRALTPGEVEALYNPLTRWRRYWRPKTYIPVDLPTTFFDVAPTQPPRPRYLGLNAFSPQAQGLVAWLPAVDGALLQARTAGNNKVVGPIDDPPTNAVNRVVPTTVTINAGTTLSTQIPVPVFVPSDFGMVPQTFKNAEGLNKRVVRFLTSNVDLSGLVVVTIVYWIYPLYSPFTDAEYWATNLNSDDTAMTNATLDFPGQSIALTTDPHIPGRWQMITVARTDNAINIWRDQTLVQTAAAPGGTAIADMSNPLLQIGGISTGGVQGINALWADFRIYNRAWTQADVQYAYQPHTRWDYYWTPPSLPYRPIPIPGGGVVTTFLSRLASLGAG